MIRTMMFAVVAAAVVSGDRRREMCADRPWSLSSPLQRPALIVDAPLGSDVAFSCAYCGETDSADEAKFWYTANRHPVAAVDGPTGWSEVTLGMADPVESNRVYMNADHSLTVRNLTPQDGRRYSCPGPGSAERVEFALDVLPEVSVTDVTSGSTSDWALYVARYLTPIARAHPEIRDIGADWDTAWGPCDGCEGKRYRRAACRVQFEDGTRRACRSIGLPANVSSSLAATLSSVPDFLLSETCYAYCRQSITRHRVPKYRNTYEVEERTTLTLMCAEATADVKVTWRKDGLLLTEFDGDGGPSVDVFGTLYLFELAVGDSGNYTCYINGNRTQEVLLAVRKSSVVGSEAYGRHLYYLYYVFMVYLVVFCARLYHAILNRRGFLRIADTDVLTPEVPAVYLGQQIRIR